jgi:hypothetical protein
VRASLRAALFFAAALLICSAMAQSAQPQPAEPSFSDREASALLRQLSESLQGHSQKQFLALFDLEKMKDGPLFKEQISSFFSQTESIAVHLNLAETTAQDDRATMAVEAEMEVQPSNGDVPARRRDRIIFTPARAGKGWKFIDVQPRGFFSLP